MKICVLRRDGQKVHNGMAMTIADISEKFFGERNLFIYKDEEEFSEMITFEINENEERKIIPFIKEVSKVNPLYTIRIKA